MRARFLVWPAVVALLVLIARQLAYALAPSPLARVLEHRAGGPSLVTVTLVSLGVAAVGSTVVVWLAALGVRERARLRPDRVAPSLRLRRTALRAVALYATSCLSFATFESYLHWRAGLGFHGLSCLVGPVHRNALPLLAALALLAAALAEAVDHLLAWARAVARELRRHRVAPVAFAVFAPLLSAAPALVPVRTRSRGPPLPA
ncbi:MAG TPA: hypothetical protein VFJ75_03855 [Gaiellaceae bacterium]|nr:hypothetical protein [Gaiellaceae bacterium]